jgi:DNA-binding response OmpR family regulator
MPRILLVEDERDLRFSLVHNLEFEGYDVAEAADGASGLARAQAERFDLAILDIMMPGMDGLEVLKRIRTQNSSMPVMMLTAKGTEFDKVIGFELGADDYLTKPFGLGEFLARVKALLRRNRLEPSNSKCLAFAGFEADFDNFHLVRDGQEIHLSQKEWALLKYLAQRVNQAVDKTEVLGAVWDYRSDATTRTVDTHIAKIRRKLGDQSPNRIIITVPTVGYKFVAPTTKC